MNKQSSWKWLGKFEREKNVIFEQDIEWLDDRECLIIQNQHGIVWHFSLYVFSEA